MISEVMPDQTQFITESPLYVDPSVDSEPVLSPEEIQKNKQKKIKLALTIILVISLIAVGVMAINNFRSQPQEEAATEEEETEISEVILGPFTQRLVEIKQELELADPNQEEFPFPPIDFEISLED